MSDAGSTPTRHRPTGRRPNAGPPNAAPPDAAPPPPPSIDPVTRVCARCGRPATDKDFCVCGANLEAMRAMLPTRGDWEKANPEKAAVPPPEPPPPGKEPPPRTRPIKWEGKGLPIPLSERMRKQILPSVLVIAVFAAIVIYGSTNSSKKGGIQTTTLPASTTSTTTQASSTQTSSTQTTALTTTPTIAACAAAWNGGRSPTHRHILDLTVTADNPPVALLATYRGTERRLARLGGGSQVLVSTMRASSPRTSRYSSSSRTATGDSSRLPRARRSRSGPAVRSGRRPTTTRRSRRAAARRAGRRGRSHRPAITFPSSVS